MNARYRNKHTGEVIELKDVEVARNGDLIYILADGSRWSTGWFHENWELEKTTTSQSAEKKHKWI